MARQITVSDKALEELDYLKREYMSYSDVILKLARFFKSGGNHVQKSEGKV